MGAPVENKQTPRSNAWLLTKPGVLVHFRSSYFTACT